MVIEKVNYQKLYPAGAYLNERIGFEASVYEGEDPIKALFQLKEIADKFHKESNPQLDGVSFDPERLPEQRVESGNKVDALIRDINSCQEKKVLESYKLLAATSPLIKEAYDKKMMVFQ